MPENPNKDYYYILRETGNTEPVLVEYGFIDNQKDALKLKNNITNYAEAVVQAVTEYIGYPYLPPNSLMDNYTVKKNDTLYSISKKFNIPISEIKRINNLQSDNLSIGQVLYFESQDEIDKTSTYIVEKGDTLYSIARKINTTPEEIKRINRLTDNTLFIGQILKIPVSENIEENNEYEVYEVQKGDSLWKISQKYNISVKDLIEKNKLENLVLQVNQQLLVPKLEQEKYIVKQGDTLWSIAKAYNLEVNKLKEINNLTNNLLSVGQELIIK